jgi:hypothetical protein
VFKQNEDKVWASAACQQGLLLNALLQDQWVHFSEVYVRMIQA